MSDGQFSGACSGENFANVATPWRYADIFDLASWHKGYLTDFQVINYLLVEFLWPPSWNVNQANVTLSENDEIYEHPRGGEHGELCAVESAGAINTLDTDIIRLLSSHPVFSLDVWEFIYHKIHEHMHVPCILTAWPTSRGRVLLVK